MTTPRTSWIPSLVFGIGVIVGTGLGMYAPGSFWHGIIAALVYGGALVLAGIIEQKIGSGANEPNWSLLKYAGLTYIALILLAVFYPGWVAGVLLAFGVEGVGLLRNSPRCATTKLKALWQRLRNKPQG